MNRKFLAGFLAASLVLTAAPVVPGMEANADAEELSVGSQTGGYLAKGVRGSSEEPDITTGLTGYYDFNDSLANKISGGGSATLKSGGDVSKPELWGTAASGSAVYVDSKEGQGKAYHFLGDKDGIRGEGLKLDVPLTKAFTISYLVNPNTVSFASSMVFSPVSADEGLNIADNWGGSTFPTVRLWGNGETYLDNFISAADGLCNQWSYITLTCDANGTFNLYVNGKKVDGNKTNAAIVTDLAGKEIFLGVNYWDTSFNGFMDEVRIYNRALTESDITGLCETVGITVEPPVTSGPETPPTDNPPVQPGDWPGVTELDCTGWWKAHTKGVEIGTDGVTVKFKNTTYNSATDNWHTPTYVLYTGDEPVVNGAGYTEYGVMRSDVHGWDGAGKTGNTTWKAGTDPIDFAKWLADNKAGADYEVSAIRKENTVFMKINAGGLVTYAAIPVKEGKTSYLSLTGEQCKLENISKADYVSFEVPDELASVAPEKPKPLAPYPVVLPTPEPTPVPTPAPTLPPADDENSEGIELECGTFWTAWTLGTEVTESGTAVTFKNTTNASATDNWNTPGIVAYSASEPKVNSDGYKEYVYIRADNWAWNPAGDKESSSWTSSGYSMTNNMDSSFDWGTWLAANKAGTDCKVQAIKTDGKIVIETTVAGLTTVTTFPVADGEKVYISLTGEKCKLTNIKTAAYTGISGITANPSATPAPSADPEASPAPSATSGPDSTEAPGTTDPGTNPGDKDPGTNNPDSEKPSDSDKDNNDKEDKETKKTMKVSDITAKAGKKKVTGKLSVKGTKVTVKIGSKKAKNAKVSGKKFTFTVSSKLKKGTKVTIKVTKSGYKAVTKTVKVK